MPLGGHKHSHLLRVMYGQHQRPGVGASAGCIPYLGVFGTEVMQLLEICYQATDKLESTVCVASDTPILCDFGYLLHCGVRQKLGGPLSGSFCNELVFL